MAATVANIGRLKLAVLLLTLGAALIVLTDVVILVALQAEISLVGTYGYGHVPKDKISMFGELSGAASPASTGFAILQLVFLGYFIFQAVKTLDHLDVEHRFSRVFSGISIIIPFVSLYVPWASLGEVRNTLEAVAINGRAPAKSIREVDALTVVLAVAWIGNSIASRLVAAFAPQGAMDTAENWMSVMTGARFSVAIAIAIDVGLAILVIFYARSVYARAVSAMRVTSTNVFGTDHVVGDPEAPVSVPPGA